MTLIVRCDDKHRLISYLYGESSPEESAAVESHLAACAPCAAEVAGLQDVRGHLAAWPAPEVDLGFTVTRASVLPALPAPSAAPPPRRSWTVPAWAQAAAAVLVLSAGAAIANLEVRYGADGLSIRTGWSRAAQQTVAAPASPVAAVQRTASSDETWKAALGETEKRLRAEFASAHATVSPQPVLTRTGADTETLLKQVRALLEASERRQQHELALRVAQVAQDFDAQRRADLVRIEQNMGEIQGVTGAEAVRQRELLNYLVRVSSRR